MKQRKSCRIICDVGEAAEGWRMSSDVGEAPHSSTLTPLHLRLRLFSNPSAALPMSQLILQPFRCFNYMIGTSPTSPGEPPMPLWCLIYPWWFCNLQWLRPAGLYERCKLTLELKRLKTPVLEHPSAGSSFLADRYSRITQLHECLEPPYITDTIKHTAKKLKDKYNELYLYFITLTYFMLKSLLHLLNCLKNNNCRLS